MRCHSLCILSHFRCVLPFVTTWTVACQTSLSMGFSREEYWNGLACPPPGDLLDPGSSQRLLRLLHWQTNSLPLALPGKPHEMSSYCVTDTFYSPSVNDDLKKPQGDDNASINVNIGGGIRMCMLSCVWLFATPWTGAHQPPLSMGFPMAKILEWVAISFSRGSSRPRDQTYISCVSCIGRQVLYHWTTWKLVTDENTSSNIHQV